MRAIVALFPIRQPYEADAIALLQQFQKEAPVAAQGAQADRLLKAAGSSGHLAYSGKVPVGVIVLRAGFAAEKGGDFANISALYVARWCRDSGVGTKLLHAAEAEGRAFGWQWLRVSARDPALTAPAVQFFQHRGFAIDGEDLHRPISDRPTRG
ncbi:GNAT family N-acetyltransferase [Pseudorhodobacter sp. E13]|uniref:GNAT family N-acetyltransferase n=1 Tax=Pseudorhodobacter sp. E13 TaxID=2487931 RepID=UPI000F8E14FF|nr:GNAT family N-acetyltransferase [Pseudorhodobacter sp. E13]RUS63260.1 GNAT family N-acetyltransferase [Pseudorhodobacter sp. E13]